MKEKKPFLPDGKLLAADVSNAASLYDGLCCSIAIIHNGETIYRGTFGDPPEEYLLDGQGGLLPGLSALKLCEAGKLSPDRPVCRYITGRELPLSPDLTVARLLNHATGLPDPLHEELLPRLHRDPDFTALSTDEQLRREAAKTLSDRGYLHLRPILRSCSKAQLLYAPSAMDEALLCEVITRCADQPLEEFQQEHIFRPQGIAAQPGAHTASPGHLIAADGRPIDFHAGESTEGVYTLALSQLEQLTASLASGQILSDIGWALVNLHANGHSLPFARRDGFLCGHSEAAGWRIDILLEPLSGLGVLIAADRPLPCRVHPGGYRRLDMDIMTCINSQRIFPAHTRMERLSARNLPMLLTLETEAHERDYIACPAVDIASTAAEQARETFAATDRGVTVGMLSLSVDPSSHSARLESVLVDRRYRRRGFGRIMVRWVLSYLRQKDFARVSLCVSRDNLPAQSLYRSLGFELQGVHGNRFIFCAYL